MSEWKKVKIGEFLTESKVLAEESDAAHRITVRLNCKGVEKRGLKAEKEGATKYYTRYAGQFIYGKQNIHKGAFGIIPPELDGFTSSADLPAFDIDESKCVPEWIPLCLKVDERYKTLQKEVKGIGSQRLAVNVFLNVEIPLPDVSVQRKVLAKVGKKITSIALLDDETEKQKSYAKQLRQNILQEAIEGKLTADWRKQHPVQKGNPDYDAEALFDKIQAENSETKSSKKTVAPITKDEIPFEIPTNWKWVRLGEICRKLTDGSHNPPPNSGKGYPVISAMNIKNGRISLDNVIRYTDENGFQRENKRTSITKGDIIMGIIGASIGNVAIYDHDKKVIAQRSIAIIDALIDNVFVLNALNSIFIQKYLNEKAFGSAQGGVYLGKISNIPFPLPSLAEQKEIVARVEQHLQTITQLESQIATRETTTKQLMQSILKDAFEE